MEKQKLFYGAYRVKDLNEFINVLQITDDENCLAPEIIDGTLGFTFVGSGKSFREVVRRAINSTMFEIMVHQVEIDTSKGYKLMDTYGEVR